MVSQSDNILSVTITIGTRVRRSWGEMEATKVKLMWVGGGLGPWSSSTF